MSQVEHTRYLTMPELVERLESTPSKIRRLIQQRQLAATKRDGVLVVPELFLDGNQPLHSLHGTLMLLHDAGFSDEESLSWMLETNEILGDTPISALRSGRKTEVRRVAQSLAF